MIDECIRRNKFSQAASAAAVAATTYSSSSFFAYSGGAIDCGRRRRRAPLVLSLTRRLMIHAQFLHFIAAAGRSCGSFSRIHLHCLLAWIDIICDPARTCCVVMPRHTHKPALCRVYPNCSIEFFISLPANLIFRFCTGILINLLAQHNSHRGVQIFSLFEESYFIKFSVCGFWER